MALSKVAVIFDNNARPDTTGVYCRRALGQLVEVEHFLPTELSRIPRRGFDLYLQVDDGLEYRLPGDLRPCAWWAIDTHLNLPWYLTRGTDFDWVFTAQRDGAARLRQGGITSAAWLPLACDPEWHCRSEVENLYDLCFVGNLFPGPREELVALLQKHFPRTFVGRRFFEDMARTYSASHLVFNRSLRNDVNMRVFEALACGSLLVTNDLADNGQEELFQEGRHLVTYRGPEELLDKVRFYLRRPAERTRIARAGRAEAYARHTYRHRMESLLQQVEAALVTPTVVLGPGTRTQQAATTPTGTAVQTQGPAPDAVSGRAEPAREAAVEWEALAALIPQHAQRVLVVGRRAESLGRELRTCRQADVLVIDTDPLEAQATRHHFDQLVVDQVERALQGGAAPGVDAVVCPDLLEQIPGPGRFLRRMRSWLRPLGEVVVGFPNLRQQRVLQAVLDGDWPYEPDGAPGQAPCTGSPAARWRDSCTVPGSPSAPHTDCPARGLRRGTSKGGRGRSRWAGCTSAACHPATPKSCTPPGTSSPPQPKPWPITG